MGRHVLSLFIATLCIALLPCGYTWREYRIRRSIELSATNPVMSDTKLPTDLVPSSYSLHLHPVLEKSTFTGRANVTFMCVKATNRITLHAHYDLRVDEHDLDVLKVDDSSPIKIRRVDRVPKKPLLIVYLHDDLSVGVSYETRLKFGGDIWENTEGIFEGKYKQLAHGNGADTMETKPEDTADAVENSYIASYFRPHHARRVFPCFDEPAYKIPFDVSIVRPRTHHVLFNTRLERTDELTPANPLLVIDVFKRTPPMSTFTFGFLISDLQEVPSAGDGTEQAGAKPTTVRIWSRRDFQGKLADVHQRVKLTLAKLQEYLGVELPLEKLDIVALPGYSQVKPADNWGLIIFKESELLSGYYNLAQELVYQWLGSWITPHWWSDAHVNKAIAGYLSSDTTIKIDGGDEFEGKYPMTIMYSMYYEFSKRYPFSRITQMKHETTCGKTELVLRMLNYTLGEETFRQGLQKFIQNREFKTFYADDVWEALTKQAHLNHRLCESVSITDVVNSWITKDRVPMVRVERSYENRSATVTQKLFLRERPHDVPDQEKMLWWIPLVVVPQNRLNFVNVNKVKWMKNVRQVVLEELPKPDEFIIVNPEEIGPFLVNYDERNWVMLANFLQNEQSRTKIPAYTRAKLLHDAWNLAYAGDLSFAIALNMTLFMKNERNHLVWNPVFTLIDHIGRHIDMAAVHEKFTKYVRIMLTPLYEELVEKQQETEDLWKTNLRSLAKVFMCRVGYKPCIEEAQRVYKKWMESPEPDMGNPVANQYICPLFKWGTLEEWEFGLQRVTNFPETRVKSERTYLLKTLAGCPTDTSKIERLLNVTILEDNTNFTDTDISLIFRTLSSGSSGYLTLIQFLKSNWNAIKLRFVNRESLWDIMISSATGSFTTQEGFNMVSKLYVERQGQFGTAEHIIEKSLKNIKEEIKWSNENLPVIEKWLDQFLLGHSVVKQNFLP